MSGVRQERSYDIDCPHCRKSFAAEPIEGGRAVRYLGFKCPHCKLFVPLQRATAGDLSEPLARDSDAAS